NIVNIYKRSGYILGHHHDHHHTNNKRGLFWCFIAIFSFMIVEVIGGFLTNSLALLSDAGHMLSDAFALALSLFAFKIGEKQATEDKTFGFKRFEIIAAFINGLTLIIISLYIFYEAYNRFLTPPNVSGQMMFIAILGLIVNIIVFWMLMRGGSQDNLNIKSALLHVLGDLLGSIGAIVAILILVSAIRITKDSLHVLMEGKPYDINAEDVKQTLEKLFGVVEVHDLHIWSITAEFPTLTCHLVVENNIDRDYLLLEANHTIKNNYQIAHCTIQIEGSDTKQHQNCDFCH